MLAYFTFANFLLILFTYVYINWRIDQYVKKFRQIKQENANG